MASGKTVPMGLGSTTWFLRLRSSTDLLEGLKYVGPQLASLSERVIQRYGIHTLFAVIAHTAQVLNNTLQPDRFTRCLRCARLKSYMDDVDVKMIISRLVVHIKLELVAFNLRVHLFCRLDEFALHVLQPGDVLDLEIPQAPDVSALYDPQEMQSLQGLAVPVQIRQKQKALVARLAQRRPIYDIFHLFPSLNNIKHPIQSPFVALGLHERSDVLAVDLGRFGDETHALFAVLLDMLLRTGVNEVDLQIGELVTVGGMAVAAQVPKVDVVGAQILERPETACYGS